jgi:hypothetical protein
MYEKTNTIKTKPYLKRNSKIGKKKKTIKMITWKGKLLFFLFFDGEKGRQNVPPSRV